MVGQIRVGPAVERRQQDFHPLAMQREAQARSHRMAVTNVRAPGGISEERRLELAHEPLAELLHAVQDDLALVENLQRHEKREQRRDENQTGRAVAEKQGVDERPVLCNTDRSRLRRRERSGDADPPAWKDVRVLRLGDRSRAGVDDPEPGRVLIVDAAGQAHGEPRRGVSGLHRITDRRLSRRRRDGGSQDDERKSSKAHDYRNIEAGLRQGLYQADEVGEPQAQASDDERRRSVRPCGRSATARL